jgi:uncharacterized protein
MTFLSLWVYRSAWIWGPFLAIASLLAYKLGILQLMGVLPLLALMIVHWILTYHIKAIVRLIFVLIACALSFGLLFHLFPGFCNWKLIDQVCLGKSHTPYNLWLNFDKPFIGLFLLTWSLPLIHSKNQLHSMLKKTLPFSVLGALFLAFIALLLHQISWDPKLPRFTLVWGLINLFFVVIPEEAFFRGFIQEELFKWLGRKTVANIFSVLITSLIFALLHLTWVSCTPFLILVFIAGLVYGTIYQITRAIESSIICHFFFNLIHFLFFTYPTL